MIIIYIRNIDTLNWGRGGEDKEMLRKLIQQELGDTE